MNDHHVRDSQGAPGLTEPLLFSRDYQAGVTGPAGPSAQCRPGRRTAIEGTATWQDSSVGTWVPLGACPGVSASHWEAAAP